MAGPESKYGFARIVIGILDLFGVLTAMVGLAWFLWSAYQTFEAVSGGGSSFSVLSILGLLPAAGTFIAGFLIIANGQLVLASLDAADDTREILRALRKERSERGGPAGRSSADSLLFPD